MLEVSAFPSALVTLQSQEEGLQPWRAQHAGTELSPSFPRQHAQLSLNEILLSSPRADPTEQQFCNTCCSEIYHLNPQTTFANSLGNYQPFFPMGISSEELSGNRCLEGSSGGHLV